MLPANEYTYCVVHIFKQHSSQFLKKIQINMATYKEKEEIIIIIIIMFINTLQMHQQQQDFFLFLLSFE